MMKGIGLVLGLIVAPGILAWLGHKLRGRSARARGAFWGGLAGYGGAMVLFFIATLMPPLLWGDASLRETIVYWGLLAGAGAGAGVGAVWKKGSSDSALRA